MQTASTTPPPSAAAASTQGMRGAPYQDASKQLRKVGCAHAEGDVLRAMYADLLASRMRGAMPARIYAYLGKTTDNSSRALREAYQRLCEDVWAYTDALLTEPH